ncbi:MAG: Protoporphyrinogen oxidase [Chlamydiia bacterium]|nr:Protoporphyrinogen oxidase [Chlamydiia bacterium]MCH9614971.1 Protoporphyrinogen oxidase [Chlamydiia bacterium]MCH9629979.1 Protoporphyrinogen oxidase [Chlamydiia bacterium]
MRKRKVAIIGAGITGLSAAHYLRREGHEVQVFEKSDRAGGVMQTIHEPYFFEQGPRTFQAGRCPELLALIRDVGLEDDLIYTSGKARYVFEGSLKKFPMYLALLPLLLEPFKKKGPPDESVWDFAKRRLGRKVADRLVDPMVKGIYSGDAKELSVAHCFPMLKALEGKFYSMIFKKKGDYRLFTLKNGMSTLVDRLSGDVMLNTEIKDPLDLDVDQVFDARPPQDIPCASLDVTNVVFETPVLKKSGFGFLVPSSQNSPVLGVIFDSEVFPEQNRGNETRLTIMSRGGDPLKALEMLEITNEPIWQHTHSYKDAIAQYPVGFSPKKSLDKVTCIGPSVSGVAVNSCVKSIRDCNS